MVGEKEMPLRRFTQALILAAWHEANHFNPGAIAGIEMEVFPHRVLSGPATIGEHLIYDRYGRRLAIHIALCEVASCQKGRSHGPEERGPHLVVKDFGPLV